MDAMSKVEPFSREDLFQTIQVVLFSLLLVVFIAMLLFAPAAMVCGIIWLASKC